MTWWQLNNLWLNVPGIKEEIVIWDIVRVPYKIIEKQNDDYDIRLNLGIVETTTLSIKVAAPILHIHLIYNFDVIKLT